MSRRKLSRSIKAQPPEPHIAEKYLLDFDTEQLYHHPEVFPRLSAAQLFGVDQLLRLEIGCGSGDFLCALARQEPDQLFIGVDISWKPLYKAVEYAVHMDLHNIRFIRGNFKYMYPLLILDSLETVFMHFPDPNITKKFKKRQLFTPMFLEQIQHALVPGGRLSVMTDVLELFVMMLGLIETDERYEKVHQERYLIGYDGPVRSRYQRIWERYGLPTLRFEVSKR